MALKQFKKIAQKDFVTAKAQDNNEQFNNQFRSIPFLDGRFIQDVDLDNSTNKIEHKLGREPLGYIITYQSGNSEVWQSAQDELFLTLDRTNQVTINLWVF